MADTIDTTNYDKGVAMGRKVLGGGLGRMGTDKDVKEGLGLHKSGITRAEGFANKAADLTSRYEKISQEGTISKEAQDAMRAKMASQMAASERMAGMKMGGAMGGAKGASMGALMAGMQSQQAMGRANIERDIFLQNEATKMQGLQGMERGIAGELAADQNIRDATKTYTSSMGEVKAFDIGQATAEKELLGSMGMQYEQIAANERAAKYAADAQVEAAKAQAGGGGFLSWLF